MKTETIYSEERNIKPMAKIEHHGEIKEPDFTIFKVYEYYENLNEIVIFYFLAAEDVLRYMLNKKTDHTYKIEKITP
jgi:hypothetical protein